MCPIKKTVLRNFEKFTGKHLCQSLFLNKVAGMRSATLFKKKLWHRCFLVNFAKFPRTFFLQNTSGQLFLYFNLKTDLMSKNTLFLDPTSCHLDCCKKKCFIVIERECFCEQCNYFEKWLIKQSFNESITRKQILKKDPQKVLNNTQHLMKHTIVKLYMGIYYYRRRYR